MGLSPPVSNKNYNQHVKKIEEAAIANAEDVMKEAADRLRNITVNESPQNLHTQEEGTVLADVAVTVDGTWQ